MTKQILFIIDRSGSMDEGKLDSAKKGIKDILTDASGTKSTIEMDDRAGLISFDDSIDRDVSISPLSAAKDDIIDALGQLSPRDQTALYDAIGAGVDDLTADGGSEPWIICLTDGEENASKRFRTDTEVIEYAKQKGIELRIIIIGIGDDVDHTALLRITSSFGGQYVHSTSSHSSIRTSILQAAKSMAKGGTGKAPLPERVEIDIEQGKTGNVEAEELERHSIPSCDEKTKNVPIFDIEKIKEKMRSYPDPDPKKNGVHENRPVHANTSSPDLCGDITDKLRERMHKVVKTSKHILEKDMNMSWDLSVPVEYIDKKLFLELWPGRSTGRFCEYFSNIAGSLMEIGEDDRWKNPCFRRGKPFIHFLSDIGFGRNEKRYVDRGVTSPGIYVREDYRSERSDDEKMANLWFGMAYSTLNAMDYYLNCRSHAVRDKSDLHSFMYSVMALHSLSREELACVIENADITGPWAIPLYIVRKMSMIPPDMVLEYLMTILPMAALGRRESADGGPGYEFEMRAIMEDLSHVVKHLLECKHGHRRPQDLWKLLSRFISHRRMMHGDGLKDLVGATTSGSLPLTGNVSSDYDVLFLRRYEQDGRTVAVFEVTKHDDPFSSYCVRCAVGPSSAVTGAHCTCKDFKYNSGPAGRPCKHILHVLKDSFIWKSNGHVATLIKDAFFTTETYV